MLMMNSDESSPILMREITEHISKERAKPRESRVKAIEGDYTTKIKQAMNASDNLNMRILGELTLDEQLSGIRVSDMVATKFEDDGKHSWIDLDKCKWHIKADYTKNRCDRTFDVPAGMCALFADINRPWLLCKINGEPYASAKNLLGQFKDTYGYNYGEIRKSAAQRTHDKDNMGASIAKANVLGHRLETQLTSYVTDSGKIKVNIKRKN
jgi:hypothetical protein